jgi:hypothetical protein
MMKFEKHNQWSRPPMYSSLPLKIYLVISALVWTSYGTFCVLSVESLKDVVGFEMSHWSAVIEIRAMYGGAQIGLGLFSIAALLMPGDYAKPAVLLSVLIFTGLVVVRTYGLLVDGPGIGLVLDGSIAGYNSGALWLFEVPMLVGGILLLGKFPVHEIRDLA